VTVLALALALVFTVVLVSTVNSVTSVFVPRLLTVRTCEGATYVTISSSPIEFDASIAPQSITTIRVMYLLYLCMPGQSDSCS
jgi:hypothetical protein